MRPPLQVQSGPRVAPASVIRDRPDSGRQVSLWCRGASGAWGWGGASPLQEEYPGHRGLDHLLLNREWKDLRRDQELARLNHRRPG